MLSISSSKRFSSASISSSTSGTHSKNFVFKSSIACSSRSSSLMAKKRFCPCGIWSENFSSTSATAFSNSSVNRNPCSPLFPSKNTGLIPTAEVFFAAATTFFTAKSSPVPFSAEISTASQPRRSESLSKYILSPFFSTISIMLTAITIGMPSSISCVERYRFRSRFVPSIIFIIASGFSPTR